MSIGNGRTKRVPRGLAALGLAAAAAAAQGQSVTAYGILDVALEHVDSIGAQNATLSRMPGNTGSVPSRLGFRGSDDLGGGLRGVFTLEMGFAPDTGVFSQGNRGFGRQAFVGLAGAWGALTFGRQYTMLYWSLLDADQLGPNLYGSGSLDAYIPNARADNAIAYKGTFSGLTLGGTYSFGRDTVNAGNPAGTNCPGELAGDRQACRGWSALVKYDRDNWGAALAWDEIRGGPGAFGGLTSSALKDSRLSANGYVRFGELKTVVGLVRRDNQGSAATPKSELWWVGGLYPVTPLLHLEAQVFRIDYKGSANGSLLAAGRATYYLSKRTAVYTTFGQINNDGTLTTSASAGGPGTNTAPGGSQLAWAAGLRHSF